MQLDRMPCTATWALLAHIRKHVLCYMHNSHHDTQMAALCKHCPSVLARVDAAGPGASGPHRTPIPFQRMITGSANKLFVSSNDSSVPAHTFGYAIQARAGLTRALQAEIDDGQLNEKQPSGWRNASMRGNQGACFDLEGTARRFASTARLENFPRGVERLPHTYLCRRPKRRSCCLPAAAEKVGCVQCLCDSLAEMCHR